MNAGHPATKRRRCGSGLMPPRRLSSPVGINNNSAVASDGSSSPSGHDALAGAAPRKRTCFRNPCTPIHQQAHAFSGGKSRAGHATKHARGRQTPSTMRKLPTQVVVTPPSCLLSSFSGDLTSLACDEDTAPPGQSTTVAKHSVDSHSAIGVSMNCSFDSVLDSQVFGLVDELEEMNRQASAEGVPQPASGQAGQATKSLTGVNSASYHQESIIQQLFAPDASESAADVAPSDYNEGVQARSAVEEHACQIDGRARSSPTSVSAAPTPPEAAPAGVASPAAFAPPPVPVRPAAAVSSARSDRLQAGLKALQSPDPNTSLAPAHTSTSSPCLADTAKPARRSDPSPLPKTTSPLSKSFPAADLADNLKLAAWGIPDSVVKHFGNAGVSHLFPWQAECLVQRDVLAGRNLVYSAPTSGGKSIVAELLLLKRVLETRRRAILILPFVSVAREKAKHLQRVFADVGIRVGAFVGSDTPRGGFTCVDVAVCTIERANSLVNRLLEEGRVSELCMMIVDELHMLGDSHRGYLLELLLTKVQFVSTSRDPAQHIAVASTPSSHQLPAIQIVGMSATLPNLPAVACWLNAELYCTDFRPVPLTQYVKAGDTVYDIDMKKVRSVSGKTIKGDDDDIFLLSRESLAAGHGVLIFCPTKARCEKVALSLAEMASRLCPKPSTEEHTALSNVADQLKSTPVGLDSVLSKTLPYGIAFHHAGLTMEERDVLEAGFRQQSIRLLVATSTLASGVNLPARRVLIRTPHFHGSLVNILSYHQMVGRAGRKGLDDMGESFMICKASEKSKIQALLQSPLLPVHSCLAGRADSEEGKAAGMQRALLEIIVSRVAKTHADILRYASNTLLAAEEIEASASQASGKSPSQATGKSPSQATGKSPSQATGQSTPRRRRPSGVKGRRASSSRRTATTSSPLRKSVLAALQFLLDNEFIAVRQDENSPELTASPVSSGAMDSSQVSDARTYYSTQLGNATMSSSLSPGEALEVFAELQRAQRCFVLENELHIVYQVTPIYLQAQWPGLDWYRFLSIYSKLPADLQRVGDLVGVEEAFLVNAVHGGGVRKAKSTRAKRQQLVHRRFYTALALHDLVHEVPLAEVAAKYSASRGLLQSLQQAAATFAGMVTVFCSGLGWHNLQLLLDQFQSRLIFGVERQLCDMLQISLLDAATARALYNSNLHTLQAIAAADVSTIESILRQCSPFRSRKDHDTASVAATAAADRVDSVARLRRRYTRRGFHYDLDDGNAAAIIQEEARALVLKSGAAPERPAFGVGNSSDRDQPVAESDQRSRDDVQAAVTALKPPLEPQHQQPESTQASVVKPAVSKVTKHSVARVSSPSLSETPVASANTSNGQHEHVDSSHPDAQDSNHTGNSTSSHYPHQDPPPPSSQPFDVAGCQEAVDCNMLPDEQLVPTLPTDAHSTVDNLDAVDDYPPEELEALADAMELGAMSGSLFSHSQPSDKQHFNGFISASRLLHSPELARRENRPQEHSHPSASSSSSSSHVDAATASAATASVGKRSPSFPCNEESSPAEFRRSRLVCSTPLDSASSACASASARYASKAGATQAHTRSSTPEHFTNGRCAGSSSHVKSSRSSSNIASSPQLISASMLGSDNISCSMFDQSQDLFDNGDPSPAYATGVSLAREDSEGFNVDVCYEQHTGDLTSHDPVAAAQQNNSTSSACADPTHQPRVDANQLGHEYTAQQPLPASRDSSDNLNIPEADIFCTSSLFDDLFTDDGLDDSLLREASQALSLTPAAEKNFVVIDICGHRRLLRTFLKEWSAQTCYSVSLACESQARSDFAQSSAAVSLASCATTTMGTSLFDTEVTTLATSASCGRVLRGISVCWEASEIYYMSLDAGDVSHENDSSLDGVSMPERLAVVRRLLCSSCRTNTLYTFDLKETCRNLSDSESLMLDGPVCDVRLCAWMLNPDRNQRSFAQLIRDELPNYCKQEQDSLYYLATTPHRPARLASVATAALTWLLMKHFKPLLIAEDLWTALEETESRAALAFARMELCGMGADPAECNKQQLILQQRLTELEEQAFGIAGHSFALTSPADVSTVLFHELRLPPDPSKTSNTAVRRTTRSSRGGRGAASRLQKFSTNKEVLIKLSSLHPLPAILLEWRRINSALSKVVLPLRQELKEHSGLRMARVHCVVQLHTATGRIALSDPNVQNVPKEFNISVDVVESGFIDQTYVSMIRPTSLPSSVVVMRDFFVPSAEHVLVAADYSQLELRLLAHLSADPKLCAILHDVGADVFRSMASEWLHIPVSTVSTEQRQQAKQVCYGMLYGIGAKGLATQLSVDVNAASKFMNSFKQAYAVVTQFMDNVVRKCRSTGYVITIAGRKRFLPNINSTSPAARSQAERQAVNTTIQGSAADLVKTAMINIDEALTRTHGSVFACHHRVKHDSPVSAESVAAFLVLQLHDELMYEVRRDLRDSVGGLVKREMENALSLSVPMPVKLKCGASWGKLEDWIPSCD
ncbi:DNA polymerase theta-like [Sycon ciliatum]|uniref:DNA polymerase theta-like n=1 Tax=Sycon ciliatum TaxID=27933 RepID=UPI0031F5F362